MLILDEGVSQVFFVSGFVVINNFNSSKKHLNMDTPQNFHQLKTIKKSSHVFCSA